MVTQRMEYANIRRKEENVNYSIFINLILIENKNQ